MIDRIRNHKLYPVILLVVLVSLLIFTIAYAANISGANKWAFGANIGWLNFAPSHGGGVTVYTDHLEGYVWAENAGWIRLGSDGGGGDPFNYDNSSGQLSGYAWGATIGWINFNPTHGGVTINTSTGDFDGYAWGENVGWIHFKNGSGTAYKVTTSSPTSLTLSSFTASAGKSLAYLAVMAAAILIAGFYFVLKGNNKALQFENFRDLHKR
jgi:hypothetical protein